WGLLFVLVLTMISGARELMTPGAWEKQGLTYRLKKGETEPPATGPTERERENKLQRLRAALWDYARKHEGNFPPDQNVSDIPPEAWRTGGVSGAPLVYYSGGRADGGVGLVAFEPEIDGRRRFALLSNGEVHLRDREELARVHAGGKP